MSRIVNAKERPSYELTPQQIEAIGLLLAGKSGRETAEAVNVKPETLSRWRHTNAAFAAALNLARAELAADTADAIRQLRRQAVDVVAEALNDADTATRYKLALAVLRLDAGTVAEPLTPEQTELAWSEGRNVNLLATIRAGELRAGTLVLPYID